MPLSRPPGRPPSALPNPCPLSCTRDRRNLPDDYPRTYSEPGETDTESVKADIFPVRLPYDISVVVSQPRQRQLTLWQT